MPYKTPEERREYAKKWVHDNPDKVRANSRRWREKNRELALRQGREQAQKWRANNPSRAQELDRKSLARLRSAVFAHYGEACACCGESEAAFLSIDHVAGGGNAHRRSIGRSSGTGFYRWLRRQGFPPGFQTLCHNCNHATARRGICPHRGQLAEG